VTTADDIEPAEDFRQRARVWIAENLRPLPANRAMSLNVRDEEWERTRELQRQLYEGGFAGLCFPGEYGGLGLTRAHQTAFNEEVAGYEMPVLLNTPTLTVALPTLLDFGTEEQKRRHIPPAIRGEKLWVQLLSEPSGGSDLAGVLTRAEPDGDGFRLSGSKIWSSAAYVCDWGLCLARTDWAVPKHQGLTMFLIDMKAPGITVQRIRQVNGNNEFCQEYFENVYVSRDQVLGEVNDGWSVASRQLFHERTAVGGGSKYLSGSGPGRGLSTATTPQLVQLLYDTGQQDDPRARELVAELHALTTVQGQLIAHIVGKIDAGELDAKYSSVIRLFKGEAGVRRAEIGLELAGTNAVTDPAGGSSHAAFGVSFLFRQASALGGGSSEMSRNVVAERVLGMPREYAADRGVPFNQVRHGR